MSASDFIKCLLLEPLNDFQVSLRDHVIQFYKLCGKRIAVQSLAERFTPSAVSFIQRLLNQQMQRKVIVSEVKEILKRFSSIYVQDSTRFTLPANMVDMFDGYGGAISSDSIANIQFCYEVKRGEIAHLQLNDGSYQDQTAAREDLPDLQSGALIIRDLGYYALDVLQKIHHFKAYFISRLKPKVTLYEKRDNKWVKLNLKKIKNELKKKNINFLEKTVWLGKELPVRLYISLAPAEVTERRLRKTNKHNKGKGHQTSSAYKDYAALNLFITNVDDQLLSTQDIPKLYRLRWQIELIFKTWKSYYQIHELKNVNPYRILCYIYSSLLLLLLHWNIFHAFNHIHYEEHKQWLSVQKFAKAMMQSLHEQDIWFDTTDKTLIEDYLFDLYQLCSEHMRLEKRKKRINYDDLIQILK